jgi:hypothetical protein
LCNTGAGTPFFLVETEIFAGYKKLSYQFCYINVINNLLGFLKVSNYTLQGYKCSEKYQR